MSTTVYPLALRHFGRGRVGDLLTADVRCLLATSAYTPAAADEWALTPAAAEAFGTGYTTGGQALTGRNVDNDTAGRCVLTCTPLTWPAAGFVARWAVLYVSTGNPGTAPLLAYADLGADISPGGQDYTLTFPDGVLRLGPPA